MTSYLPCMNDKLLALIDKAGISEKRTFTEQGYCLESFREQMSRNKNETPEKEYARNEIFLSIDGLLDVALSPTLSLPGGKDALVRFVNYSEQVEENA